MHILLMQGEGDKRTTLQALLEKAGHQITVSTVPEEVESFSTDCDVVLLNPDELPDMGSDLVTAVRRQDVPKLILMVSDTHTRSDMKALALTNGVDDYLDCSNEGVVLWIDLIGEPLS